MRNIIVIILLITVSLFYLSTVAEAVDDSGKKVLKQGLIGAGTGAVAAGASGGKAGKGALIGAGTSILGNILLDTITEGPATEQQKQATTETVDLYQQAYQEGYTDGFKAGYKEGLKDE